MKLGLVAGVDTPLGKRLAWVAAFRLGALVLFLFFTEFYYFKQIPFGGFSSKVALSTIGVAFGLSAAYAVLLRRGRWLPQLAYTQLVTDQLTWTAIVFITGGVTSGATSLYGLTCLSGAILLYAPGALTAAAAGIASYVALCAAMATGLLLPPLDQSPAAYVIDAESMVYPALSAGLSTALVCALAVYLAERLRTFGGRLQVATERAEQAERLAAMGKLAAALAHEIRNPLGSIQGSMELLRTGEELGEEDRRLCGLVEREVARLNDLVGDMLHLSRPREPEPVEVELASLAKSVVDLARSSARGADLHIRYEGPELLRVVADGAQMRQVLWNLVRNAVQTSPPDGEVVVRIVHTDEGDARLEIVDQGPGIPDSKREMIFDPFYSTRSHGVGIGLAVVKQIADQHRFEVEVDSTPDEGSCFAVRIPHRWVVGVGALVVGLMSACSPARGWLDPAESPDEPVGEEGWWDGPDGGAAPSANAAGPAPAALPEAAAPATSSPASADAGPVAIAMDGGGTSSQPASHRGLFRNTYYDFPRESPAGSGATRVIYDLSCQPIRTVSKVFHDKLCVQGSGRLLTGQTVSFAKRNCDCASECPRTGQKICFEALDPNRFPHGRGALGTAITPARTVAVDPSEIPLSTVLYIPEFHGLRDLQGRTHDGCFIAQDRGLRVRGRHVDVFTGDPKLTRAWNRAVPSNEGVHVIIGASRCAHLQPQ